MPCFSLELSLRYSAWIDYLQGAQAAAVEIDAYDTAMYSVISWMEVMVGADTAEERFAAEG